MKNITTKDLLFILIVFLCSLVGVLAWATIGYFPLNILTDQNTWQNSASATVFSNLFTAICSCYVISRCGKPEPPKEKRKDETPPAPPQADPPLAPDGKTLIDC